MTSFQDISTLKAKIQKFEHDIPFAPSKDAALDMAIKAAEHAMKAMRLSDSPETTKAMRNKSEFFLDEAQRIKSDPDWKPRIEIDVAKVAKLVEPKSSRPLPTSEQILLLKASQLNGFKFPPWTSFPKDNDFQLQVGQEPFIDKPELRLSAAQLQVFDGWKRAAEALPPPAWYTAQERGAGPTMSSSRTIDLVQDAATDCSVVASLCALVARGERGHAKILGSMMFPYDNEEGRPQMSQNGKYALKLNFNGTYRKVDIDDRLPVSKSSRVLHVIDRHNPSLLWPALIEKAYLKVRGSYDFPGSNSGTDLWILSGWIPEQIFLQSDDTIPNNIWKRIYKSHQYGDVLVTMGTGKISNRTERAIGLAGEHDYAVLDMREVDGQKLMLVKNPWCEGMSWKGSIPRSPVDNEGEEDEEVLPSSRDLLNSDDELTPGTFWMDLNSVMQYFESIYLNWNPGLFSYRQDIHFAWDLSASSPSSKFKSFGNHQQFRMSVASPGTAWLLLNRHFKDGKENVHPSEYISLYVFDNHGAKVYLSDGAIQRGPFVDSPQTLLRLDNLEADKRYTIVPVEQDLTQATHTFTLSAFANARITIDEAPNKYRCQNVVSSSWTEETAGGNAHSPTYSQNPQFSITVAARTPIGLLLETAMEQLHVHVKLVHGRGSRVQAVRSKDIVFDSKDYRRGCALAQFAELDAGTYTIICSTFEAGQKGNFKLRVDSNAATQLSLLPRQGAGRLRRAWAKAAFEGQQRILAAPIAPRRLTKLDVFVKQVQQTNVHETARMGQRRERSMIRVTLEIGKGPERRILIASSNGEYSDSSAGVRTGEIDLSPQEVGKAWLVIERMFTPADLEGEIFQVETFTDAPDTVDIGVWRRWEVD
ncbi:cysteine proteinase [Aureobasidium pullulans]|uniref:Cysteine proteinase n=1 Tax=Aureobasidium pullulans TaxID=5580 RepID=A0A4T0AZA1_AURPU|nr:cysteine proteinase [Aureobasidium pullulans]THZ59514.1 cysteine proteinase [Aureobasidium pullulans]TIA26153.1 cysteine proteinase [Aureobasidium pullulans]